MLLCVPQCADYHPLCKWITNKNFTEIIIIDVFGVRACETVDAAPLHMGSIGHRSKYTFCQQTW